MLTKDQYRDCLSAADKAAGVCTRLCRLGISIDDGNVLVAYHNGISSSDSDEQRVHNASALAMASDPWTARLKAWLLRLHDRQRYDLAEGKPL